ncbi:MAG: sensor histidine kinase [Methylobacter sp.]
MPYRHKIRFRIFLTYPVLGLLLSVFMLVFLKTAFTKLERRFMDSYLTEELEHFIKLTDQNPALTMQRSKNWVAHKVAANNSSDELAYLSSYPEGIHEIERNQHGYDIAIKERNHARYIIIYDDTDFETLEYNLMTYFIAAVFIILWLATWYGLWFSKKVIEPVTSLATRIKMLNPEKATGYLAQDYTDDEVGILALEFDAYSRRLQALIQREREFTGNASHELRTPLAVIMASSEGLLLRPDITEPIRLRVQRIQSSAIQMAACLDTLLNLARHPVSFNDTTNKSELVAIIEQLIVEHSVLVSKNVKIIKEIQGQPDINAPGPIISMLMGNLIKNAFTFTSKGSVTIFLNNHEFSVIDTGQGIDNADIEQIFERGYRGASSQGSGLGLAISKRICEHYNWQLKIKSSKNKGTHVQWIFNPP